MTQRLLKEAAPASEALLKHRVSTVAGREAASANEAALPSEAEPNRELALAS